jgi:hypothetical protein
MEHEGFVVIPAMTLRQVAAACQNHTFDAVVLGHSLSPKEKERIVEDVKDSCKTGMPVIGLYVRNPDDADRADYAVSTLKGPKELIDVIRGIFSKRPPLK